ncbi:MAG: hypothetical protein WCS52_19255 [bacterium]
MPRPAHPSTTQQPTTQQLPPPPFPAIDIHVEQVGRTVEQLLWRIDHPRDPRVTVALEPTLVSSDGV